MLFPTMNAGVHAVPVQHPVRRERLPPIPVQQVLTTNADRPVKTVLRLVHPDILRLIPADVMIQRPMNAVIPAINRKPVAPIPVPVVQNTTQVLMPQLPNVVQPAITVQTVAQAVLLLIPDPMPQPRNAVQPVTLVQTLVQADLLLPLVLRVIHQLSSVIQNAEALVIPVSKMILVITILQKHAPTDVRSITVIVLQNVKRASLVQILVQVDLNLIPIILEQHVTVGTGLMYRLAQPNAEVFVWNVILALTVPAREWPVTVLMTIVHKQERAVFVQNVQLVAVTLLTVGVIIPIPAVLIVQKSIKPLTSKVHAVRAIIVATKQ